MNKKTLKKFLATGVAAGVVFTGAGVATASEAQAAPQPGTVSFYTSSDSIFSGLFQSAVSTFSPIFDAVFKFFQNLINGFTAVKPHTPPKAPTTPPQRVDDNTKPVSGDTKPTPSPESKPVVEDTPVVDTPVIQPVVDPQPQPDPQPELEPVVTPGGEVLTPVTTPVVSEPGELDPFTIPSDDSPETGSPVSDPVVAPVVNPNPQPQPEPKPEPAPADNTLSNAEKQQFRNEMTNELRDYRTANAYKGGAPINQSTDLNNSAQEHADWMAETGRFEHSTGDYRENIWKGNYKPTASHVVDNAWANSTGHANAMKNFGTTEVGFGMSNDANGNYYVVYQGR